MHSTLLCLLFILWKYPIVLLERQIDAYVRTENWVHKSPNTVQKLHTSSHVKVQVTLFMKLEILLNSLSFSKLNTFQKSDPQILT